MSFHKALVLGGVRSGKTAHGMSLAIDLWSKREGRGDLYYMATAEGFDEGMQARIARHQRERASHGELGLSWHVVEESLDIVGAMQGLQKKSENVLLLDCLSVWLGNLMFHWEEGAGEEGVGEEGEDLESYLRKRLWIFASYVEAFEGDLVLISSEVGLGIISEKKDVRLFGDLLGELHQRLGQVVSLVDFVAAGFPMRLKGGKE